MTGRRVATIAALVVVLTAGCGPEGGTVQAKRQHRSTLGVMVRELCIGDSAETCTWIQLEGKYAYGWYHRCQIGERYPDCRAAF